MDDKLPICVASKYGHPQNPPHRRGRQEEADSRVQGVEGNVHQCSSNFVNLHYFALELLGGG